MSTVALIVNDALQYIRVLDANEAPEAEDMATGIRQLNLMVRRWEADGLALGWTDVSAPEETLPAPAEAEQAIGYNLAVMLAPRYGVPKSSIADVVSFATSGLNDLLRDQMVATPIHPIVDVPCAEADANATSSAACWYAG